MRNPFRSDDLVEVAGHTGIVQNLNTRTTILLSLVEVTCRFQMQSCTKTPSKTSVAIRLVVRPSPLASAMSRRQL
ncbi:mechanosensitive ion channel domain-containing protein [Nitrobacter sp. TKz-YC01]|uniref:mechanosensitive ion channel domain-containing protein n=1 Tax=Nitrobacter sp. TKz-YC01 TaxID=3398703 RepID=UPI003A0FCA9E